MAARAGVFSNDASLLRSALSGGRFEAPIGFVVGFALLISGALAGVAALAGLVDGARGSGTFALLSLGFAGLGAVAVHECRISRRVRSATAFAAVFALWLTCVGASTAAYMVVDTFGSVDDALFESVAGYTTTAATIVDDPEALGRSTLTWRAGTQWLGGLGGLLFVVSILPSLGVGGLDVTSAGERHAGISLVSHRTTMQLRRLATLYVALTTAGIVLFLVGGMSPFDAVTYAATTISTGGFANHLGSFGHFDSTTVEWAGIGGMFLGGCNLAVLFALVRDRRVSVLRSFELRAYATAVVAGSVLVAATTAPTGGPTHESIRHALFHVTSAASTTGHFVGSGWGQWAAGPQVLLLALMAVGAMSGSAGGGFRQVRALALVGYLRRELSLQAHANAVVPVRVGRRTVGDAVVDRMIGYQAQYVVVAATGAVVVAAFGTDLVTSISGVISALANVGPGLGELVPGSGGVRLLSRPARAALMPLMLLGRLEIAPVLVGAAVAGSTLTRR